MTQSNSKSILIVAPSWVGDTVMAQSLFKLIKQSYADVVLHVLAPEWTFSMLERMPEVDKAIAIPFRHGELKLWQRYRFAQSLRQYHYDQAIVLPNSLKSALIPWFAGIPVRTGWRGEYRYILLNDLRVLDKSRYPLMVEQYAALGLSCDKALAGSYPYPAFNISKISQQTVLDKFSLSPLTKPVLALAAGAAFGTAKRWPATYYAEIARQQIAKGWDVWLFGSAQDATVTGQINQLCDLQCRDFAGQLHLAETIDLLSMVDGMVSNDSGLMHVAAALDKPVVAIYGPTSPSFTPPLSAKATILQLALDCQPCFARECPLQHHKCMFDLKPERVAEVVAKWGVRE